MSELNVTNGTSLKILDKYKRGTSKTGFKYFVKCNDGNIYEISGKKDYNQLKKGKKFNLPAQSNINDISSEVEKAQKQLEQTQQQLRTVKNGPYTTYYGTPEQLVAAEPTGNRAPELTSKNVGSGHKGKTWKEYLESHGRTYTPNAPSGTVIADQIAQKRIEINNLKQQLKEVKGMPIFESGYQRKIEQLENEIAQMSKSGANPTFSDKLKPNSGNKPVNPGNKPVNPNPANTGKKGLIDRLKGTGSKIKNGLKSIPKKGKWAIFGLLAAGAALLVAKSCSDDTKSVTPENVNGVGKSEEQKPIDNPIKEKTNPVVDNNSDSTEDYEKIAVDRGMWQYRLSDRELTLENNGEKQQISDVSARTKEMVERDKRTLTEDGHTDPTLMQGDSISVTSDLAKIIKEAKEEYKKQHNGQENETWSQIRPIVDKKIAEQAA